MSVVPVAENFGDDGEWMLIEGHHDPQESAWAMLAGFAELEGWADAADLVDIAGGWLAFVNSLQFIHATNHGSGDWTSLHTKPGTGSRPVTVLSFEDNLIKGEDPHWPEHLEPAS